MLPSKRGVSGTLHTDQKVQLGVDIPIVRRTLDPVVVLASSAIYSAQSYFEVL